MMHFSALSVARRLNHKKIVAGRWMPVLFGAFALVTSASSAWAGSATTTTLYTTPQNPSSGAVITMTAQVSSTAHAVGGGTVTFVDTFNGVSEPLGTVEVESVSSGNAGQAVLETEVGGVGKHSFVATYSGTSTFAGSASSAQAVTFAGPYGSATALASSGTSPNATLSATVSAFGPVAPTGNVTFTDTTSNVTLGTAALNSSSLQSGFTPYTLYPISNVNNGNTGGTVGPAIGDFNRDGRVDYAVPTNGGPIVILLGNGDGTFTTGTPLATTSPFTPTSAVVGDFNGDGKQDLAVLSAQGVGSVNIFLGNGDGTFNAAVNYPVATANSASRLLAIGDFNGDGFQDLVASNSSLNQVAVILGNGDGTFNAPSSFAVGGGPWNIVVGDINQDGISDLAIASDGSTSVTILLGKGNGTFQSATYVATPGSQVGSVAIGDFNGDGFPDLATTSAPDNSVYVMLSKGTATPSFRAGVTYTMNYGPYYLTLADFNRDGNLDIISANNGNSTVGVLLNTGSGAFSAATSYNVGGGSIFANVGDINGDDAIDLTTVTGSGLSVLLSGQSETVSISNVAFYGCGAQSVNASYVGDSNYGTSTSASTSFTPARETTTLTLTAAPTNSVAGQQVTLTATLSPYAYGSATSNGEKITFTNNGTTLGTGTLASGVATLSLTLGVGTNSFQASYAKDCALSAATSNKVTGTTLLSSTLTWATPAAISYGTPLSATQLNATDNAPGGGSFVYTPAAGTVLGAGNNTLSVTFTPKSTAYGQETKTVQLTVNQDPTVITWPTPTAITYGTPLSSFQLDASASAGAVSVPLSSYFNVSGIYTPGTTYNNPATGGFDNDGYSYSTSTLSGSVVFNGLTYTLGPNNAPDAVANTTITLPTGKYTNLYMLGAMVNNIAPTQTFTVTYTDGTTTVLTQKMSDWFNAAGWPGESVVNCSEKRNYQDGTQQADSVCVYGYQIALNAAKTVSTIQLPATRNIVMLAMDLTTAAIPGTFVYTPPAGTIEPVGTDTLSVTFTPTDATDYATSTATVQLVVGNPVTPVVTPTISWPANASIVYGTPLSATQLDAVAMGTPRPTPVSPSSQLSVLATSPDGTSYSLAGFDGSGGTYSYNQLNNGQVNYAGTVFTVGANSAVPDAITSGAVYTLPTAGNYSTLYLIGAATTTGQTAQPFTLTYQDSGNPVTETLNISSWTQPAGYTGESVIATTAYKNNKAGTETAGTFDLYGYQLPIDPSRTLVSVTVPNNRNVVIMALGFGTNTQVVVPGSYVYTPPSGTVLSVGTHPLAVAFTPSNSAGYTGANGTNSIVVTQATPVITWPTPNAIAVNQPLTSTQLNATASFQGQPLAGGTFVYSPAAGTSYSTAGTYTLNVTYTPADTTDFTTATASVQIVVGSSGSSSVAGSLYYSSGDCCFFSQLTPYTVTVGGSGTAPTGNVTVTFAGNQVGSGTLIPGSNATSTVTLNLTSSYFTPGNNSVTLNYLGDSHYVANSNTATIPLRNPVFPYNPASVGGNGTTVAIPYTFVQAGSITFTYNPANGSIPDYATSSTDCSSGTQEPAGFICTFTVAFKPVLPGIRRGALQVNFTSASNVADPTLYLFLSGLGDAAQISLSNATQVTLNSTLNQPQSLVFNPADVHNATLYVANSNVAQLDTTPSSPGPLTQWNASHTTSLKYPSDLVYDSLGDLVVTDANAASIFKFTPALAVSTVNTGSYTLGFPTATRIDFGGNIYIADAGNTPRIVVIPGETYASYTPTVLSLGSQSVSFPQALAVDNAGANLYIGDGSTNQVLQVALSGTGTSLVTLAPCDTTVATCSFNSPAGFAFDPNGDMFVTDSSSRVLMIPVAHSTSSPTTQLPFTGLDNPSGVALDGSGNIYVTDLGGMVVKLLVNAGALPKFTTVGATQVTTLTNTGNLALTVTGLAFGSTSTSFSETDTCKSASIAPGATCTVTVKYANTGGPASDTLTITSNAFSASGVTIALSH